MARLRVLYFVERFWPYIGGVEVVSARVLPALAERGIEIALVTSRDGDDLPGRDSFGGIDIHRFPIDRAIRANDAAGIAEIRARLAALKRDLRPDLVHMIFTGAGIYFPLVTARASPCPMLLGFHGSWPPPVRAGHSLLRRIVATSTWFTACSEAALDDLCSVDDSIAARAEVIVNGLDGPEEPGPIPFDPPLLLCSCRLEPEKGIDLAIEAVAALRDEFPGLRLLVAGDGTARPALEQQVRRLGLEDAVELAGWWSPERNAELVARATIVLVPSRLEGFGLSALEGMLGARPVVAARSGGLVEVLGDDGGVLVEPGNGEALAAAIRELLSDRVYAERVAAAGRARAQARFPLRRCVDAYENLYLRLANGHAS